MKISMIAVQAAVMAALVGCATTKKPAQDTLIAHRGESDDAPENTLPAYRLAGEYGTALADSFAAYEREVKERGDLLNLLSHWNHPSPAGHALIARELTAWFPAR